MTCRLAPTSPSIAGERLINHAHAAQFKPRRSGPNLDPERITHVERSRAPVLINANNSARITTTPNDGPCDPFVDYYYVTGLRYAGETLYQNSDSACLCPRQSGATPTPTPDPPRIFSALDRAEKFSTAPDHGRFRATFVFFRSFLVTTASGRAASRGRVLFRTNESAPEWRLNSSDVRTLPCVPTTP